MTEESTTQEMNSVLLEQEILETKNSAPRTTWQSLNAQAMAHGCGDFRSEGTLFMARKLREWAEDKQKAPCPHCGEKYGHGVSCPELQNLPQPVDMIDHPPHYNQGDIEPIDVIEDWNLSYHLGQVLKYIARAKHKGRELEDLRKAQWYLARAIGRIA